MLDRDKKKEPAPNCAAFYPFAADIFLSQRKIDHIARFVELPVVNSIEDVPSILVVNVQVPLLSKFLFLDFVHLILFHYFFGWKLKSAANLLWLFLCSDHIL